jgi:glyoxylase-like metal-dependent hydrolase (beta-lactamase superfamily II)
VTYRISSIDGNRQWLDGGAMFGNVPRLVWEAWEPPDQRHRILLACRSFLIQDQKRRRLTLLEAGIGACFEPKLSERYGIERPTDAARDEPSAMIGNLRAIGVTPEQIDDVILSHLHFDHAGGLLSPSVEGQAQRLVFPRARFWVGREAWTRANKPHLRDRASFLPQLNELLKDSGRLHLIESGGPGSVIAPELDFVISHGHTPGQLLTRLRTERGEVVFAGDLIPGCSWVHLPVTMGYDRFAEGLIDEKRLLLEDLVARGSRLLLTHDARFASCRIEREESGRFVAVDRVSHLAGFAL